MTSPVEPTSEPRVSINMPVYNCEAYIRQTLDSVLAQTFEDWECVIVDDASTDRTADIAESYAARDPRFRVHRLDAATKKPYPACRNVAIELSRGRWLAPLDGDDWWEPWKLERQVALAESEPGIVICCARAWIWENGKVTGSSPECTREQVADKLPLHTVTTHPAVLLDRQATIEVGMYDLQMQTAQDWELWLRFLWRFGPQGFAFLQEPCMYYRRHANNVTAGKNILKCSRHEWIVIRRTLSRYGWGLKNPIRAWRVLNFWLVKDAEHFREAKMHGIALRRVLASLAIYPISGWRWQVLRRVCKDMLAHRRQPRPTAS